MCRRSVALGLARSMFSSPGRREVLAGWRDKQPSCYHSFAGVGEEAWRMPERSEKLGEQKKVQINCLFNIYGFNIFQHILKWTQFTNHQNRKNLQPFDAQFTAEARRSRQQHCSLGRPDIWQSSSLLLAAPLFRSQLFYTFLRFELTMQWTDKFQNQATYELNLQQFAAKSIGSLKRFLHSRSRRFGSFASSLPRPCLWTCRHLVIGPELKGLGRMDLPRFREFGVSAPKMKVRCWELDCDVIAMLWSISVIHRSTMENDLSI